MSRHGRVLLALTSTADLPNGAGPTGYFLPELAHPWRVLSEAGFEIDLVSVLGGEPPVYGTDVTDPVQQAFLSDVEMQDKLRATARPGDIDPARYDALVFVGGHGAMWDFPGDVQLAALARAIYEDQSGVLGAVCHGPAGLVNISLSDGTPLLAGRTVAAFTATEEADAGLAEVVPFDLAHRLVERGARHSSGPDWKAHVVTDGRLVTGQNPASARGLAFAVVAALTTASPERAATERYFDAENRRDLDDIAAVFADDVEFVGPDGQIVPPGTGIRDFYSANASALPTLEVAVVDEVNDGGRAAIRWRARGITADGSEVFMRGTNIVTVAAGRFTSFAAYWGAAPRPVEPHESPVGADPARQDSRLAAPVTAIRSS